MFAFQQNSMEMAKYHRQMLPPFQKQKMGPAFHRIVEPKIEEHSNQEHKMAPQEKGNPPATKSKGPSNCARARECGSCPRGTSLVITAIRNSTTPTGIGVKKNRMVKNRCPMYFLRANLLYEIFGEPLDLCWATAFDFGNRKLTVHSKKCWSWWEKGLNCRSGSCGPKGSLCSALKRRDSSRRSPTSPKSS